MVSVQHPAQGPEPKTSQAETNVATSVAGASREPFIPIRKAELVDLLSGMPGLNRGDSIGFRNLCRLLDGLLHREYQSTLETLKSAYAPFDPDADTRSTQAPAPAALDRARDELFSKFGWLLERGNFHRLKQQEIDRALEGRSHWGLSLAVDFEIFERLELYYRGSIAGTRFRRRLANRFRPEAVWVPIYQRLVMIFRLRPEGKMSKLLDTHDVHIKLFKDIPQLDVEMLLPGTRVRMSLLDRMRIVLPTVSGVSLAVWKIVAVATAPLFSSLALLGLVGGTVGYGVRSLYGYLNTRQKYQLNLTQSLYYQNLDSNAGVIHRLLDDAEEQENREVLLGYFLLWQHGPPGGWTAAELDERIETFLRAQLSRDVDFEIADALSKLARFDLVESYAPDKWKAVPIDRAQRSLELRWAALPASITVP